MKATGLGVALLATATAQMLATGAVFALPVLVAQAAPDFGLPPAAVGYQVGLLYLFAALTSARGSGLLARLGPVRTTQAALLAAALGVALLALAAMPAALAASALIGSAYGLTNPAASQILGRLAPTARRNLVFAVKQMGVPLGVALAGLALPPLAAALGWRAALLCGAAALLAGALALQPLRAGWDIGHGGGVAARPLRLASVPALGALARMGAAYALVQIALSAHMVAMLVLDFGWGPVAAGALVGLCQAVGALARVGWAVVADAWRSGLATLALIGVLSALLLLLLPLAPGAPPWAVAALFVLLGATAAGWNGVLVAEAVRLAPPGAAGAAAGAVLSPTFVGAVVGPVAVALLSTALGGYTLAFALTASLALAGAALAWRAR